MHSEALTSRRQVAPRASQPLRNWLQRPDVGRLSVHLVLMTYTVLALFPALQDRLGVPAGSLSGGEQQMLALARSLLGNPRLLIVDEPTEGLSPQMVQRVAETLAQLKREGLALLLIEQKLDIALDLADEVLVLGRGEAVFRGTATELRARPDAIDTWVGVA